MMGTQEAIYCGVPTLGIPMFADQNANARDAEALGYGLTINDLTKNTKNTLLENARKILYDPK